MKTLAAAVLLALSSAINLHAQVADPAKHSKELLLSIHREDYDHMMALLIKEYDSNGIAEKEAKYGSIDAWKEMMIKRTVPALLYDPNSLQVTSDFEKAVKTEAFAYMAGRTLKAGYRMVFMTDGKRHSTQLFKEVKGGWITISYYDYKSKIFESAE